MPRKLWRVQLHFLHADCYKHPLTSAGLYPHHVLHLDCYYSLTKEIHGVPKVHKENNQLEPNYPKSARCRTQEAVPYSCNVQCVWYESGPVTEAVQIGQQRISAAKKVTEQHKEVWLLWIVHYLLVTNCKTFVEAGRQHCTNLMIYLHASNFPKQAGY